MWNVIIIISLWCVFRVNWNINDFQTYIYRYTVLMEWATCLCSVLLFQFRVGLSIFCLPFSFRTSKSKNGNPCGGNIRVTSESMLYIIRPVSPRLVGGIDLFSFFGIYDTLQRWYLFDLTFWVFITIIVRGPTFFYAETAYVQPFHRLRHAENQIVY